MFKLKAALSLDESLHFVYPHYFFALFEFIFAQFPTWIYAVDRQKKDLFHAALVCVFNLNVLWPSFGLLM